MIDDNQVLAIRALTQSAVQPARLFTGDAGDVPGVQ
jgi:hypothetical protein